MCHLGSRRCLATLSLLLLACGAEAPRSDAGDAGDLDSGFMLDGGGIPCVRWEAPCL